MAKGPMIDFSEVILRLGGATLIGTAIGLNRDLHGKPIGVRTLGLVGLASAMATLAVASYANDPGKAADAASRVIQGVLTGIGFLGAGVIVRRNVGDRVHGLTSAASAWATACLGLICGLAEWRIVGTGLVLVFVLLVVGGPFERLCHRWLSPLAGHYAPAIEQDAAKSETKPETPAEPGP
jgi:putative Mg2+ transporter-C (MgtC) family protein